MFKLARNDVDPAVGLESQGHSFDRRAAPKMERVKVEAVAAKQDTIHEGGMVANQVIMVDARDRAEDRLGHQDCSIIPGIQH